MPVDGIEHVIGFQLGRHEGFEPPLSWGLRPAGYGTFTVNLGVYLPAATRDPDAREAFVAGYRCHVTQRLGSLLDDPQAGWWPMGSLDARDAVIAAIGDHGLPWLDRFASVDAVLQIHQLAPELLGGRLALWPWSCTCIAARSTRRTRRSSTTSPPGCSPSRNRAGAPGSTSAG